MPEVIQIRKPMRTHGGVNGDGWCLRREGTLFVELAASTFAPSVSTCYDRAIELFTALKWTPKGNGRRCWIAYIKKRGWKPVRVWFAEFDPYQAESDDAKPPG